MIIKRKFLIIKRKFLIIKRKFLTIVRKFLTKLKCLGKFLKFLFVFLCLIGHPGGPHDPHNHHPAFSSGGPPPGAPHHQHHNVNNNNNNNNNTVKVCAGCGGKIVERFLLHALDRYWHNGCLKCSCCAAMLADIGSSCFTKGGMILCKQDYMR